MKEILIEGAVRLKVIEPEPAIIAVVAVTHDGITTTTTGATQMAYTLPGDKKVQLKISYKDANGNAASIDGQVSWDTSDPSLVSLTPPATPEADNSSVMVVPGSKVGSCQVSARADADLGAGVRELVTLMDITIVGGEAVTGTIEPVGEPVPKA